MKFSKNDSYPRFTSDSFFDFLRFFVANSFSTLAARLPVFSPATIHSLPTSLRCSSLPKYQQFIPDPFYEENPPIGIIICREKNKTIVEYALRNASRPLGVATYSVVPSLPENFQADLPSPQAIARLLEDWNKSDIE